MGGGRVVHRAPPLSHQNQLDDSRGWQPVSFLFNFTLNLFTTYKSSLWVFERAIIGTQLQIPQHGHTEAISRQFGELIKARFLLRAIRQPGNAFYLQQYEEVNTCEHATSSCAHANAWNISLDVYRVWMCFELFAYQLRVSACAGWHVSVFERVLEDWIRVLKAR